MKTIFLLSLFIALMWQGSAAAQCTAPLTITSTANPGEVTFDFDLGSFVNPAEFIGSIGIYNMTTSTGYGTVYVTQGTNPYTYQFPENGTYDLYTTTMDSLASCVDTAYYSYLVTGLPSNNCDANFSIVNDSTQTTTYWGYNYSTGTNLTYFWDFGDGGTSTDQFPTHTFASVGVFNVCLTVDDGNGCTDQHCQSITVFTKASQTTINIYDPQTAGLNKEEEFSEISVYPNPTNGDFYISFAANDIDETVISILDLNGRVIASKSIQDANGQNKVSFDLLDVAPGLYFWQINNDTTGKVVIR